MTRAPAQLPIIDVGRLISGGGDERAVAAQIDAACREAGFFYVVGHGVDDTLQGRLVAVARRFFAQDLDTKMRIRMALGGRAWRGYFPVGGELTSGEPDGKEGLYFGAELGNDHPLVAAGTPLHGPNLFPPEIPELRAAVLDYMAALTRLGQQLMTGIALGLGLEATHFATGPTADPLVLFRIFHYPRASPAHPTRWGVGEHTDYGVLTILLQDETGGLEVGTRAGWVEAPPIPGSFVCNLGDMLERMTHGLYRSTPHRVRPPSRDRLSLPFFFDPGWTATVEPLPLPHAAAAPAGARERWDGASVHEFRGRYGEYLLRKVAKVFPALGSEVL